MKKTTITIMLAFIVSASIAQTKKRYFKTGVEFTLNDGCEPYSKTQYMVMNSGTPDYTFSKNGIAKWVKPYKVLKFKITSMEEFKNDKGFLKHTDKFKHCEEDKYSNSFKLLNDYTTANIPDTTMSLLAPNIKNISTWNTSKIDTVQVLAYCIDDFDKPSLSWKKLYAIYGFNQPSVNFNGLMVYQSYLMPDRKTPVTFKVVYAINKP